MPPPSNPTELARETFKLLASRRIAPTPQNYQRIYNEISGGSSPDSAVDDIEENLAKAFDVLGRKSPGLAAPLKAAAKALESRNWSSFQDSLAALGKSEPSASANWPDLLRELLKQWDLKHAGLTSTRKKEALERVLINFGRDPVELHAKLRALTKAWSEGAAGTPDIAMAEPKAGAVPAAEEPVPPGRGGVPLNVASPDDVPAMLAELLAQALLQGVMPRIGHLPDLAREVNHLASEARNARKPDAFAALSKSMRQFWIQLELRAQADSEILDGLMRLLKLVIDNITELLLDDQWLRGQLTVIQDIIAKPLDQRVISDAEKRFKEVIFKQGTLKHSLNEAKTTLKTLVTVFIERIGAMSESTGEYHKKIEGYTTALSKSEDMPTLSKILQEILSDTRALQLDMVRSHDELVSARRQVEAAEQRIKALESELGEVSELVYQDYLTGTLNRRGMEDAFEREFARCERHGVPLCVGLLDVDHFKRLNDTYGHEAGDQALVHLANVVKEILRPTDTVARYGGEEFVVILPDTSADDGVKIMVRLQRELTKRFFLHDNNRILITFSAGVAQREGQETPESMIARADGALYRAKEGGRNRVYPAVPGDRPPPSSARAR
jgi:diguanylate cyclase